MRRARIAAFLAVAGAVLLPVAWAPPAAAQESARAHYLANEGLMVALGETKVLFDPLFNESFGQYELLPESMREALFAGEPPWDGVDAVFISLSRRLLLGREEGLQKVDLFTRPGEKREIPYEQ